MFDHQDQKTYLKTEASGQDRLHERREQETRTSVHAYSEVHDLEVDERSFQIRMVANETCRSDASSLIHRMYATRGYTVSNPLAEHSHRYTMTISEGDQVLGTITMGIDSPSGILADEIFKDEIDVSRRQGRKVCELTKLAFDPSVRSKVALASLFHMVLIYVRRVQGVRDVFIEVNPRHRRFYERMLGFTVRGPKKMNPRVNAPAYLLCVDTDYVEEQVLRVGGTSTHENAEKTLYPYFFCPISEQQNKVIIEKYIAMLRKDPGNADVLNALAGVYQASRGTTTVERMTNSH